MFDDQSADRHWCGGHRRIDRRSSYAEMHTHTHVCIIGFNFYPPFFICMCSSIATATTTTTTTGYHERARGLRCKSVNFIFIFLLLFAWSALQLCGARCKLVLFAKVNYLHYNYTYFYAIQCNGLLIVITVRNAHTDARRSAHDSTYKDFHASTPTPLRIMHRSIIAQHTNRINIYFLCIFHSLISSSGWPSKTTCFVSYLLWCIRKYPVKISWAEIMCDVLIVRQWWRWSNVFAKNKKSRLMCAHTAYTTALAELTSDGYAHTVSPCTYKYTYKVPCLHHLENICHSHLRVCCAQRFFSIYFEIKRRCILAVFARGRSYDEIIDLNLVSTSSRLSPVSCYFASKTKR